MKLLRALIWLAPIALAGCGEPALGDENASCTLIGCAESFIVELEADPPNGEWPAGAYRIEVTVDSPNAGTYACEISLPTECGTGFTCDPGTEYLVGHAGCADQLEGQSISNVYFGEAAELESLPTEIAIEVFHDGASLGSESFAPEYDSFYPNGEACDESQCHQAPTATMQLQF